MYFAHIDLIFATILFKIRHFENALNHIKNYGNFSDESLEIIREIVTIEELPSRFKLLKAGVISNKLHFIISGAARGIHIKDKTEVTTWFSFENNFATSFSSFISRTPSSEEIELIEDSTILSITHENLEKILNTNPEFLQAYKKILQDEYIASEKRFLDFRYVTAKERYDNLIIQYPKILQRIPLGIIASYLGITQETLS